MRTKSFNFGLITVIALGAVYVGASYYIGVRAEQHIRELVSQAQAQSDKQLVFEQVSTETGLFASSGHWVMQMPQVTLNDDKPVELRVQYNIDHALHWSHLAKFDWSVTPQAALAKTVDDIYPTTPSLTGQGKVDWTGSGGSSIGFPGLDQANIDGHVVSIDDLVGQLSVTDHAFDFKLNLPSVQVQDASKDQSLIIKNLGYEASSPDTRTGSLNGPRTGSRTGSVTAAFVVDRLQLESRDQMPFEVKDYRWQFDLHQHGDVVEIDTQQTARSVLSMGSRIDNLEIGLGMQGLHRSDLVQLGKLLDEIDGDITELDELSRAEFDQAQIDQAQIDELQNIILGMLARGVTLQIPAIKGELTFMGNASPEMVGLEGFSLSAQILDTATGAGQISTELESLAVPAMLQAFVPEIEGLKLDLSNRVVDGRSDIEIKHALARYQQQDRVVKNVKFDLSLSGLTPDQLGLVGEILGQANWDWRRLSQVQQTQLQAVLEDAAQHGLRLSVPVAQATLDVTAKGIDVFKLEGLDVQVKLDDVATGAGQASVALRQLSAQGPEMRDIPQVKQFMLTADNRVVDGKVDYDMHASVESFEDAALRLGNSSMSMTLSGLWAADMQRLSHLTQAMGQGLSTAQEAELAQIARRAIDEGFAWAVPKLDLMIDDAFDHARVQGSASIHLDGLGQAPLAAFDVARLAQLQAKLSVAGQSPAINGVLAQGQAMGLLTNQGEDLVGQVVFENGQLLVNGKALPAREYVLVANAMVQGALASAATPKSELAPRNKPRRGPD
ncbi:MAG TPA: DUF945 family protein [Orrella sp.]